MSSTARSIISRVTLPGSPKTLRKPCSTRLRGSDRFSDFEKHVLDTEAHEIFLLWRYRIVPYRSYVKGWKVSPSHYVNQDLATIWLDK